MNTYCEKLSLKEIQCVELDILKKLVFFLEQNSIQYILCGGTMLGAVRHNGFIPWDDDIDILVPRKDFEHLKKLSELNDCIDKDLKLQIPGENGYAYPFIKAINTNYMVMEATRTDEYKAYVWVDVFPMDHFPDDETEHKRYLKRITRLVRILSSNTISKDYLKSRGYYINPIKRVKLLGSQLAFKALGGSARIAKRIDQVAKTMDTKYKSSNYVGNGAWPNGIKDYFPICAVKPTIKHKFEDAEFNIPVNYDLYLSLFYGNYMQIPPENERVDHNITVFKVKDKSSNLF